MARCWLVLAAVLCSACAGGPDPPGDPQTSIKSGSGDPGGDPGQPSDGKGDPGKGDPGSKGDPTAGDGADCQALWAVVDDLGCDVAKLVCAVLEAIPIGGALVKCDVAVPIACGIASVAADAAEALCPR
jgi:hypothetical protein